MVSFSFSVASWRYYLRQEPDAVMLHVRIRAGGRPRGRFLPRHRSRKTGTHPDET
jgi:hypothetical protein